MTTSTDLSFVAVPFLTVSSTLAGSKSGFFSPRRRPRARQHAQSLPVPVSIPLRPGGTFAQQGHAHAQQGQSGQGDDHLDVTTTSTELDASDAQKIDDIASDSQEILDEVAGSVRDDLDSLKADSLEAAEQIMKEQTDALLEKYEQQRSDLLDVVSEQKEVIQGEIDKVKAFDKASPPQSPDRVKSVLLSVALLLGLAAAAYAWTGLSQSDDVALRYALIDMAASVCCAVLASRRSS